MASFTDRVRSAWNAFANKDDEFDRASLGTTPFGQYFGINPNRTRGRSINERTIISSLYTRMSIDISSIAIRHTRHDEDDRYLEDVASGLNDCLTIEANMDQAARAFRQDIVLTLFDKGVAAIVPVDTTIDPKVSSGYDIKTMRVGHITQWYPNHIRCEVYNEATGLRQEILLPKRTVAIVENPFYDVMNQPNSTLQRLIRKLSLLDIVDEAASSGKLDLLIKLPYVIKGESKRQQAEQRRADIEFQLKDSQYGIAYIDGTENVTQLNRPAENNLLAQIEYLTNLLFAQLGITPDVMNGTASEATMLNYVNRTVEPILGAITEALARTFITKTARTQGQRIDYFTDPFKLIPMSVLAEISDKLTRNEILTSNEIRQKIGFKPHKDPKADQLINSNMPRDKTGVEIPQETTDSSVAPAAPDPRADTSSFDGLDTAVAAAYSAIGVSAPTGAVMPPPSADLDPSIVLASLDEVDKSIDEAFAGLGG